MKWMSIPFSAASAYFVTCTALESISLTALNIFRVYCSGAHGPVLLLLHGGGHSALSWAVFTVSTRTN